MARTDLARTRTAGFGAPARAALRDAIGEAKGGDPLAPVTVVVPSNLCGLATRRALGGDGEGLVNVRFLVLSRLAELVAAPELAAAGRRPLTAAVRAEAVRLALARQSGPLRPVAGEAATREAFGGAVRELDALSRAQLDAVERAGGRGPLVVPLWRDVRDQLRGYYDEHDLLRAAARVPFDAPAWRDVGAVVLYLPGRLAASAAPLLYALVGAGRLWAVLGRTGDPLADRATARLATMLDVGTEPLVVAAPPGRALRVVSAPHPAAEVAVVARQVAGALEDAVPLHRIAVLYAAAEPYARILADQLDAAGLPWSGRSVRSLAQSITGRTALGLFTLAVRRYRRDDVIAWLTAAPLLAEAGSGRLVPGARWARHAREARVVGGATGWRPRLEELAASFDGRGGPADSVRALAGFVDELVTATAAPDSPSWPAWAARAAHLLRRYLGGDRMRAGWPAPEREAHDLVLAAIRSLGGLDADTTVSADVWLAALEEQLAAPMPRHGRFGAGVLVGPLRDGFGVDVDRLFVLGLGEGVLPAPAPDGALLHERDRLAADGGLATEADRHADERRAFLAIVDPAPSVVLSFSRTDKAGRPWLPSPWLLERVEPVAGRPLSGLELFATTEAPWLDHVPSYAAEVVHPGPSAGLRAWERREVAARSDAAPAALAADPLIVEWGSGRGVEAIAGRATDAFTEWDGLVGPHEWMGVDGSPRSPTALEKYARCPRQYLFDVGLGLREPDEQRSDSLHPMERGQLIHEVLEQVVREGLAPASPADHWSAAAVGRAVELAEARCDDFERAGRTGHALPWRFERARIVADVVGTLARDGDGSSVVHEVEVCFGFDEHPPAEIVLDDGRTLRFRGYIDRVDRTPDGRHVEVIDYKTGHAQKESDLREDLQHGLRLQLPVYALAAQQRYEADTVRASYWYISAAAGYLKVGLDLDEMIGPFRSVANTIVGSIESGLFPARPGEANLWGWENCRICPFDRICPPDRDRAWARKRLDPSLELYRALAEGPVEEPARGPVGDVDAAD